MKAVHTVTRRLCLSATWGGQFFPAAYTFGKGRRYKHNFPAEINNVRASLSLVYNEPLKAELPGVTVFDPGQRTAHFRRCFLLAIHISFIIHWFVMPVFGAHFLGLIIRTKLINFQSRLWSITSPTSRFTVYSRCAIIGCSQYLKRNRVPPN